MIALSVCSHKLCSACRLVGNHSQHNSHYDPLFGKRRIYFVVLFIWLWSFAAISGDIFGVTSVYGWTNTVYGCDKNYTDSTYNTSYGIMIMCIVNLLAILVAYSLVIRRLIIDQQEARFTTHSPVQNIFVKHIKIFILLPVTFAVYTVPVTILGWGMFGIHLEPKIKIIVKASISCIYWAMYGEFI